MPTPHAGAHRSAATGHLRAALTLFAALAAALAILAAAPPSMAWIVAAVGLRDAGAALTEAVFVLGLFGPLLAVALIGIRIDRPPSSVAAPPATAIGGGLALGLSGLLCAAGLADLSGNVRAGTGEAGLAILLGTLAIFFQSAVEEVYFRGWLQRALVRAWGPAAGLIVASLAFAALHLAGGARSPLTLLNLLLGGLLFGLLQLRSGGLLAPIAAHAAWNWAEQILLGLDPNPGTGSFGALFDLDLVGTALWGGSDEGLNASVALSCVLIALVVPLALWRRAPPPAP